MINLSGKDLLDDNPRGDIEIKFTGLRPGEKLYEELLIGDRIQETDQKEYIKHKKISYLSSFKWFSRKIREG